MEEKDRTALKLTPCAAGTPKTTRYYTLAEVAAAYGYTRSAAQGWARRPDFPAPDVQLGAAYGWAWETFESWAAEHRPDLLGGLT